MMRIKKWFQLGLIAISISSCKSREIQCIEIGSVAKKWRVHELNDTLHFKDQFGNDTMIVITTFYNSPTYTSIQKGTFLMKQVVCKHEQLILNDNEFFHIRVSSIESGSFKQNGTYINKPSRFNINMKVGDAIAEFEYFSELDSIRVQSENTTCFSDFDFNGTLFEKAIVVEIDTFANTSVQVNKFISVANLGLIQFYTRFPQRVWTRQ